MKRPEVKIVLPEVLKMQLVDDWENVTKHNQVRQRHCASFTVPRLMLFSLSSSRCRGNQMYANCSKNIDNTFSRPKNPRTDQRMSTLPSAFPADTTTGVVDEPQRYYPRSYPASRSISTKRWAITSYTVSSGPNTSSRNGRAPKNP